MRLAIYGTLRVGERLHHIIKKIVDLCEELGRDDPIVDLVNLEGYAMYHLGSFPGLKESSKEDSCVAEIWNFDLTKEEEEETLSMLDIVEGVKRGLYKRKKIETPAGKAWVYLFLGPVEADMKMKNWKKEKNEVLKKSHASSV